MFLLPFIEKIHRGGGADPAALREEFLAAGRRVAREVLGEQPRIEAAWNDANGTVEFRQVLVAVEVVRQAYRELLVEALRALGGDLAGVAVGEELELSVFFTSDDEAQARELDAQFGGLLALSCSQTRLWRPLDEALIAVVHAHLPPATWPDGSVGNLFQHDGGWLRSLRGESNGISVSIASALWKEKPSSPDVATIQHGVTLRVERGGRSLDVPAERFEDAAAVARWAGRPASPARAPALEAELSRIAGSLEKDASIDGLAGAGIVDAILRILLAEPS